MRRFIFLLFTLVICSSQLPALASDNIRVGISNHCKNMEFVTKDGRPDGVLVDLWRLWAEQNNKQVQFVIIQNKRAQDLLRSGEIDVIGNAPPDNQLIYSAPYFTYNYFLFTPRKNFLQSLDHFPIRVGVLVNDIAFLDKNLLQNTRLQSYQCHQKMLEAMLDGKIDCMLANDISLNFSISGMELLNYIEFPSDPFYQYQVRMGTLSENQNLVKTFDSWIHDLSSKDRASVVSRWMPNTFGYKFSWPLIALSTFVLISSLLLITVWIMNIRLKVQVKDATKELLQEQELLKEAKDNAISDQLYIKTLIDSITACVIAVNRQLDVTHTNKSAEIYSSQEHPTGNISLKNRFPFLTSYYENISLVSQQKQAQYFKKQPIEISTTLTITANIALLPIIVARESGVLILVEDVTEAVKKEEILLQSQKLDVINSLAGGIAHDFNNILAVISGSATMLKMQADRADSVPAEKLKKYLGNIFSAVDKGAATTKSLSTLSGRVSVNFAQFSLQDAIDSVVRICKTTLDKSVQVTYQRSTSSHLIQGSQSLIEQALLNVMINAYHAMTIMEETPDKQGGTVSVSLDTIAANDLSITEDRQNLDFDKYVCIKIKDNGVGISAGKLPQVYTPFFTTKAKDVGTGLGLTMVQNTINQHHGFVMIDSQETVGTEVSLYLPCDAIVEGSVACQESDPTIDFPVLNTQKKAGTILLADDNQQIVDSLSASLETYGYEILTAADGKELVECYKSHFNRIDIVITDLEMPKMTGDSAFFEIRKINPQAKVIMTSGFLEDKRIQKVLASGATGFIQKPCILDELISKIEKLKILDRSV